MFLIASWWQGVDAEDSLIRFLGQICKVKQLVLQHKLGLLDFESTAYRHEWVNLQPAVTTLLHHALLTEAICDESCFISQKQEEPIVEVFSYFLLVRTAFSLASLELNAELSSIRRIVGTRNSPFFFIDTEEFLPVEVHVPSAWPMDWIKLSLRALV